MSDGAVIYDRAYFDSMEWKEQKNARDGFAMASAWLDLIALTNAKAATFHVNGMPVDVLRGQCGYSKLALADRWGWSQGKVAARLSAWQKDGRVQVDSDNRRTIITVTNYDSYQTGLLALCEQNGNRPGTDCVVIETEKREERREYSKGTKERREKREESAPPRIIELETVIQWFDTNGSGYRRDLIEKEWSYFDSMRRPEDGAWQKPTRTGAMIPISDWRSAMTNALVKPGNPEGVSNGGPVSASVQVIADQTRRRQLESELKEFEQQIFEDRMGNLPRDPKKMARVRELRAAIAEIQTEIPTP